MAKIRAWQAKTKGAAIAISLVLCSSLFLAPSERASAEPKAAAKRAITNRAIFPKASSNLQTNVFTLKAGEAASLSTSIDKLVRERFYDLKAVNEIWKPEFAAAKDGLNAQTDLRKYAERINRILQKFHTSHTEMLTMNDETFFFMRSLFEAMNPKHKEGETDADFSGLGIGGHNVPYNLVRYVLDGSPAEKAGFHRGDKLISLNGRDYSSFADWIGTSSRACSAVIERDGKRVDLKITPVKQDFLKGYVNATEKSTKIVRQQGKAIGYVHFWCGGKGASDTLQSAVCETLKDTDGLILDLRDGYGAANYEDMDIFFRPSIAYPDVQTHSRTGSGSDRNYYNKPLVVLINGGVRSGKEMIAHGFKKGMRATLIGETTAGYVVAGQYNKLGNRAILYLAVVDIKLDGERIEGKGVSPDIRVEDKLGAEDAVMQEGLKHLLSQLTEKK